MSQAAVVRPWAAGQTAFEAPLDARLAFIRRTYVHVAGAVGVFALLSWAIYTSGLGETLRGLMAGLGMIGLIGWVIAFGLIGGAGRWMARATHSGVTQYAGLALIVSLYALAFAPLLYIAGQSFPGLLAPAAGLTAVTFAGLSGFVLATRKDLSFLGPILGIAGLVLIGIVVIGSFFGGFTGGLWITGAFLIFACGAILYDTSNVVHQYRTDEHVGAALELFCAIALLFQQILILLMQLSGRRD